MTLQSDVRANAAALIATWVDALVIQRATLSVATNTGGEFTEAWATNITTNTKFEFARKGGSFGSHVWDKGGEAVNYDHVVFVAATADVKEDDRIRMPGTTAGASHYTYVRQIGKDWDKLVLYCSRKRREAE